MWSLTSSEASTTIFGAKGIGEAKSVIFNYSSRKAANCIFEAVYIILICLKRPGLQKESATLTRTLD